MGVHAWYTCMICVYIERYFYVCACLYYIVYRVSLQLTRVLMCVMGRFHEAISVSPLSFICGLIQIFAFLLSWYDNPTFLLHSFSYLITNIFCVIGSFLASITFLDIEPSWTSTSNLEPWNLEQVVSNTVIMCIYVRVNFACVYVCMHVWAWKWLC